MKKPKTVICGDVSIVGLIPFSAWLNQQSTYFDSEFPLFPGPKKILA